MLNNILKEEVFNLDYLINQKLNQADSKLLQNIANYILSAGGKRLRPLIFLITVKLFANNNDDNFNNKNNYHIKLAAALELIHTATLLHDDIIDNSDLRRNRPSAHLKWGVRNCIITGDFLFALAFELAVSVNNTRACSIIANMTNSMAMGEIKQLNNKIKNISSNISIDNYLQVIEDKTALLFAVSTELAACITEQSEDVILSSRLYGLCLGMAFQITDDILDFMGDTESLGKNIGDDLLEGKITLPMLYLKSRDIDKYKYFIDKFNYNNKSKLSNTDFIELKTCLVDNNCIEDSYKQADKYKNLALEYLKSFPDNNYKIELVELTNSSVQRNY